MLAVDATTPSTILAHKAGYIDRDNEVIVGLQTDEPFKRAIFLFGGLRMAEGGLKAAGFEGGVHGRTCAAKRAGASPGTRAKAIRSPLYDDRELPG